MPYDTKRHRVPILPTLTALHASISLFYNASGTAKTFCIDPSRCLRSETEKWLRRYQRCTELTYDMSSVDWTSPGSQEVCLPSRALFTAVVLQPNCRLLPRGARTYNRHFVQREFGFDHGALGRMIFSGPELSPWSSGGVPLAMTSAEDSVYVVDIPAATTGTDMEQPSTCDVDSVRVARYQVGGGNRSAPS